MSTSLLPARMNNLFDYERTKKLRKQQRESCLCVFKRSETMGVYIPRANPSLVVATCLLPKCTKLSVKAMRLVQ